MVIRGGGFHGHAARAPEHHRPTGGRDPSRVVIKPVARVIDPGVGHARARVAVVSAAIRHETIRGIPCQIRGIWIGEIGGEVDRIDRKICPEHGPARGIGRNRQNITNPPTNRRLVFNIK